MSSEDQGDESGGGIPYIGSRISLISKKEIRYEGILYSINTKEATVALQTVRSFGTEDRMTDPHTHAPSVGPSSSIFDYIIFNGADIKDLHVCEAANNVENLPDDPAIVNSMKNAPSPPVLRAAAAPVAAAPAVAAAVTRAIPSTGVSHNKVAPQNQVQANAVARKENNNNAMSRPAAQQKPNGSTTDGANNNRHARRQNPTDGSNNNRMIPGMGGHLLRVKERGVGEKMPESSTGDFDFERCLGGFDKEKEFSQLNLNEGSPSSPSAAAPTSYQKSSFFDTISCDALDRLEGRDGRVRAADERVLNTETFGASGLNNRHQYRGRGGRGGGRGRGNRNRGDGAGGNSNGNGGRGDNYNRSRGRGRGGRGGGSRRQYGDGGLNANAAVSATAN